MDDTIRVRLQAPEVPPSANLGPYDAAEFDRGLRVDILTLDTAEGVLEFDLVGVEAALANALRRILVAEVPTMAIETVLMADNTSVLHDEMLAHRIGLVPLRVDPRRFAYRPGTDPAEPPPTSTASSQPGTVGHRVQVGGDGDDAAVRAAEAEHNLRRRTERESHTHATSVAQRVAPPQERADDTLVFELDVECRTLPDGTVDPPRGHVYAHHLQWVPVGEQATWYAAGDEPRPVSGGILLAKLVPGQRIKARCLAQKGVGKEHAKWSPVATATYRLLPRVTLQRELVGKRAQELKRQCPQGVFDVEDSRAYVKDVRKCTMCRECIRDGFAETDDVKLERLKRHYVFTIESTGALPPDELFTEAIKVLRDKCNVVRSEVRQMQQ